MRRSGKTTRLVDEAVQYLFKEGSIRIPSNNEIFDKFYQKGLNNQQMVEFWKFVDVDARKDNRAQDDFLHKLRDRLLNEHKDRVVMIGRNQFKVK